MSAGPRIVFVRFVAADSPKLMPWSQHAARVVGAGGLDAEPATGTGTVVWQLVSANNRELARGAGIHDTFGDAREDAERVVSAAADLDVSLVSERGRGVYGWFGMAGDHVSVTCARWYNNDRDRRHSIQLALKALPVARLHDGARLTDPALLGGARAGLD